MALKILLADDSMTAQKMGKEILLAAGYVVVTVSNGAAAVKKIASERPDVAVLDVYMPGYTGLEVCERIKSDPATAATPVLLTHGKMENYSAQDGARVKADGVIIKPFEATDLVAAVQKLGEQKSAAAAAAVASCGVIMRTLMPWLMSDSTLAFSLAESPWLNRIWTL